MTASLHLPAPTPEQQLRHERLCESLRQTIEDAGGHISFAQYMQTALYHPDWGYYNIGNPIFGEGGDFITSPECSPLFARCIAAQIQELFAEIGHADILEIGAGSGRFAADLLMELQRLGCPPRRYQIYDISVPLRQTQQAYLQRTIPQLMSCVTWLDALPKRNFTGVVIANEVLDALPVHLFRLQNETVFERRVGWHNGFAWIEDIPADAALTRAVRDVCPAGSPNGYRSEINLGLSDWFHPIATFLHRGAIFCIDYGYPRYEYYHIQRNDGTVMCHYRHRAHTDPLILTGLQDITGFVDFTGVTEAAEANGLELAGYTNQAFFLMSCGLDQLMKKIQEYEPARYLQYASQVKSLTLPGEMGERFKVIAFQRGMDIPLMGFSLVDFSHKL